MKSPWKEIVIALVIGIAVGWVAADKLDNNRSWRKGKMLDHFSRELQLTSDQREKIARIMETKRTQFESLRDEMRPRFEEIRRASKEEIRAILTPDQQKLFEKLELRKQKFKNKRPHRIS